MEDKCLVGKLSQQRSVRSLFKHCNGTHINRSQAQVSLIVAYSHKNTIYAWTGELARPLLSVV